MDFLEPHNIKMIKVLYIQASSYCPNVDWALFCDAQEDFSIHFLTSWDIHWCHLTSNHFHKFKAWEKRKDNYNYCKLLYKTNNNNNKREYHTFVAILSCWYWGPLLQWKWAQKESGVLYSSYINRLLDCLSHLLLVHPLFPDQTEIFFFV